MKKKKLLFIKKIGLYQLTCTVQSRLFGSRAIEVKEVVDLVIRIRDERESLPKKSPKTVYLVIAPSIFFTPIHEESQVLDAYIFQLSAKNICRREFVKVHLPIQASPRIGRALNLKHVHHTLETSISLHLFTSKIDLEIHMKDLGQKSQSYEKNRDI